MRDMTQENLDGSNALPIEHYTIIIEPGTLKYLLAWIFNQ